MLHEYQLWDNTLMIVTSDNGGLPLLPKAARSSMDESILGAGCNFPLTGGKSTTWEGGIKAVGFVTGGVLPAAAAGSNRSNLMRMPDRAHPVEHGWVYRFD